MAAVEKYVSREQFEFFKAYEQFLDKQRQYKIHPLRDSPQNIGKITDLFLELFGKAPGELKRMLATEPLFPEDVVFLNWGESRDSTRPLNYIMFSANIKGLELIRGDLEPVDWSRLGPFESTFMHCLIAGIEKGSVVFGGDPIACALELLKNYPLSKDKTNRFDQTPAAYLQIVSKTMRVNLEQINAHGGGGYGGMGKMVRLDDGTFEVASHYQRGLEVIEALRKILEE